MGENFPTKYKRIISEILLFAIVLEEKIEREEKK